MITVIFMIIVHKLKHILYFKPVALYEGQAHPIRRSQMSVLVWSVCFGRPWGVKTTFSRQDSMFREEECFRATAKIEGGEIPENK
jgi:hypothetical protein